MAADRFLACPGNANLMQTLERSLAGLVQEGLVTVDQARARLMFPDQIA